MSRAVEHPCKSVNTSQSLFNSYRQNSTQNLNTSQWFLLYPCLSLFDCLTMVNALTSQICYNIIITAAGDISASHFDRSPYRLSAIQGFAYALPIYGANRLPVAIVTTIKIRMSMIGAYPRFREDRHETHLLGCTSWITITADDNVGELSLDGRYLSRFGR